MRTATRRRRSGGFTLIEIMVVVIVLGILAAVIIPNFTGRTDEARVAKARADISELATVLEQFRLDMRRYPTEIEGLEVLRTPPSAEDAELWKGPYIRKPVPLDPWGDPYRYSSPAPNGLDEYGIESFGADKQPGGEGYAMDINTWTNYGEGP